MASSTTPHVALLAFPFTSHPNTLHAFATLLANAAPHAAFSLVTSHRSRASLSKLASPANLSLFYISDGCEHLVMSKDRRIDVKDLVPLFLDVSPGNYVEGMRNAVTERGCGPITSIVCDSLLVSLVGVVAEEMGVPWVAFHTGGTSTLSTHVHTDEIRLRVGTGEKAVGKQKLNFIPSLSAFQVSDLPEGVVHGKDLQSSGNLCLYEMGVKICNATAVALNTCSDLEGPIVADLSTKFSKCLPLGPLNFLLPRHQEPNREASDPFRCLSWLDDQLPSSVVYIAFGTTFVLEEEELKAVAEALESTGVPFLWSLNDDTRTQLPTGIRERLTAGLMVKWAPQAEVLQHPAVGAFVTHCGWKSVLESVARGVPMICWPFFFDQRMNARLVVDVWRIGLSLEGNAKTKDRVAAALQVVLKEEGRTMRERARTLGEKAMEATGEGGSSRQSFNDLIDLLCCMDPRPLNVIKV